MTSLPGLRITIGAVTALTLALLLLSETARPVDVWVDSPDFDFGVVPPNATLVYRSWIHNNSPDSLRLIDLKSGCGCLAGSPAEATIQPGDSLPLLLLWQSRTLEGPISRNAYIYLEGVPDPLPVQISGRPSDSAAGVSASPVRVKFDPQNPRRRSLRLSNQTAGELTVSLVGAPGPAIDVGFPEQLPAGGEGVVVVQIQEGFEKETIEDSFTLEFGGQAGYIYRLSIPVINGDFSHRPVFTRTGL